MHPQSSLGRRISRRAALRTGIRSGAALAGTAALRGAGCAPAAQPAPVAPAAPTSAAAASGPAPTAAPAQPKRGGTFNIAAFSNPPHLDPHQTATGLFHFSGPGMIYNRLVRFKIGPDVPSPSSIVEGDLAESWTQPDDITYIFKMRPGVKWHNIAPVNGRDFVADDVKYSFERQIAEKVNATQLAGVEKIEVVDKATLKITRDKPDADGLAGLAAYWNKVVAREAVAVNGDLKQGPNIGTGPWILETFDMNSEWVLKRNPDYFRKGLPYLDAYRRLRIDDETVRENSFVAKSQDVYSLVASEPDLVRKAPGIEFTRWRQMGGGYEVVMRVDLPPFTDKRVRQAISKAFDRQAIIDSVYFTRGWHSVGVQLPGLDYALPEDEMKKAYTRDLEGARKLLADAGYPNGFEVEVLVPNYNLQYTTTAELAVSQLRDIKIEGKIKMVEPAFYTDQILQKGNFIVYMGPTSAFPSANADLLGRHHSKGQRNASHINDPKLDDLIEKQAVMVKDPEGRKKLLLDIQRQILDDAHFIYLVTNISATAKWPYVKDFWPAVGTSQDTAHSEVVWLDK
jgi:peptide/nickel transport system substrate-binding protein